MFFETQCMNLVYIRIGCVTWKVITRQN